MGLGALEPQRIDLLDQLLINHLEPISFLSVKFKSKLKLLLIVFPLLIAHIMLLLFNLVPEVALSFDELLNLAVQVFVVVMVLLFQLVEQGLEFLGFLLQQRDLLVFGGEVVLDEVGTLTEDVVFRGVLGELELQLHDIAVLFVVVVFQLGHVFLSVQVNAVLFIELDPAPLQLNLEPPVLAFKILKRVPGILQLPFQSKNLIGKSLHFLTGPVGVLHFLHEHLLTDPVDFLVLVHEFFVQAGDLLFEEGSFVGEFGDGDVLAFELV